MSNRIHPGAVKLTPGQRDSFNAVFLNRGSGGGGGGGGEEKEKENILGVMEELGQVGWQWRWEVETAG